MSALIDVQKYREAYPDLDAAFGDNWNAYVNHYLTYGIKEGRSSFGTFDARAYADRYPDLKQAFGYDALKLYKHYVTYGRAEGRDAGPVAVVDTAVPTWFGPIYTPSNTGSGSTNTAAIATVGQLVDPESGAPVANATITFRRSSFNSTSEVVEPTAEGTENTENTETTEVTEDTEVTENTETTKVTENTEVTEDTGNTEATEDTEVTEDTENTEATEDTEETEDTEDADEGVVVGDGYYQVTTDENGYYAIPEFAPGVYSVEAAAPGYMTLTMNSIAINSDSGSFTLPTFQLLSSDGSGVNTVAGNAVDATTGAGLANVTLNIRANWNNQSGDVVATATTDADGNYSAQLQRGYYTIEFVMDGYTSVFVNVASSNAVGPCNGVLNPAGISEVTSTEFRIVLTWGEMPYDLDSHLVGPDEAFGFFHVFYADKVATDEAGNVVASLDVDDTSSYGPETVTIVNARTDATYYYSVKDYTNGGDETSMEMSSSGANVKVYQGSALVKEYNVPLNSAGYIWNVFKIENGTIVDINNYNADEVTMYGDYLN